MRFDRLKVVFSQNSELSIAVIGLACCLTPLGSKQLTTLTGIYPVEISLILRHFISFAAALAVFVFVKKESRFRFGEKRRWIVLISIFFSLCLLAKYEFYFFGVALPIVEVTGKLLEETVGLLLVLIWAERLIPYGMKPCLAVLASSFITTSVITILLSFFQQIPSMLVISLLPLISGGLYGSFKTSKALRLLQDSKEHQHEDSPIDPSMGSNAVIIPENLSPVFHLIIFCLAFITGHIIGISLETQQFMAASPIAQIGIACGILFAGALILLLLDYLDDRLFIGIFSFVMFALLTIALYLSTFTQGPWVSTYLFLSYMVGRFIVLLLWMIPFLFSRSTPAIAWVALGYAALSISQTFSASCMVVERAFALPVFNYITSGVLVILLACSLYFLFRFIAFNGNGSDEQFVTAIDTDVVSKPFQDLLKEVGTELKLTPQEQRILTLLAKGRNVKYISESLVITTNTVKSHMRNIYAKLNVHTQQELINLVDSHVEDKKRKKDIL